MCIWYLLMKLHIIFPDALFFVSTCTLSRVRVSTPFKDQPFYNLVRTPSFFQGPSAKTAFRLAHLTCRKASARAPPSTTRKPLSPPSPSPKTTNPVPSLAEPNHLLRIASITTDQQVPHLRSSPRPVSVPLTRLTQSSQLPTVSTFSPNQNHRPTDRVSPSECRKWFNLTETGKDQT